MGDSKDVVQRTHFLIEREPFSGSLPSAVAHLVTKVGIGRQVKESLSMRLDIAGGEE